jgi:hypothetical protein
MTRRLCLLLVCALAPIALVTGCGGGGGTSNSGKSLSAIKHQNSVNSAKTYAECRQAAANPGLPPNQKAILETECQDIKADNLTAEHAENRALCVAEADALPADQRAARMAICKKL